MTRIRARLDSDVSHVAEEIFWAEPTDRPGDYRVANLLSDAPISLGDVVRVSNGDTMQLPHVVDIVSRTEQVTLRIAVLSPDAWEGLMAESPGVEPGDATSDMPDLEGDIAPDPADGTALALATKAVANTLRDLGADVERLFPQYLAVRLPAGIGVDSDAWTEWLAPVEPERLREADPLLPPFWLLIDDVCGPHKAAKGLLTGPAPESPTPRRTSTEPLEPRFIAIHQRPCQPGQLARGIGEGVLTDGCDDSTAGASGFRYATVPDLEPEAFNVLCFAEDDLVSSLDGRGWEC